MTYTYKCQTCEAQWDESQFLRDRDLPLSLPCPKCSTANSVKRIIQAAHISYEGNKSIITRAGNGWNDLLTKVKGGSGRGNTIHTK